MIEVISVEGGKFHRITAQPDRRRLWEPLPTVCGRKVTPLNFFQTIGDADRHTGGRMSRYLCKHCASLTC